MLLDRRDILRVEDGKGGEMQWHEERDVQKENRSCFRGFFLSRVRYILAYIYTHTYTVHIHSKDENDAREGERGTWHASGIRDCPLKPARVDTKCYSAHGFHARRHILSVWEK